MSTEFTASNGVIVHPNHGGYLRLEGDGGPVGLAPEVVAALTEFVLAQADEKYGRVRLPEYPDYVIYPMPDLNSIDVFDERDHFIETFRRTQRLDRPTEQQAVARLYFERYPEPTPLPTEPGHYLDKNENYWNLTGSPETPASMVWHGPYAGSGNMSPGQAKGHGPFTRLVPEVTP